MTNFYNTEDTGDTGRTQHDFVGDESAILDGEQGITSRLRELPDGFAEYAHDYVVKSCASRGIARRKAAELAGVTIHKSEELHAEWVEQALLDFVDALLDSWQIEDIALDARSNGACGMYVLHNGLRDAEAVVW